MQLKKKLIYSGLASASFLIVSIFIPIVPCRLAPGIPNPIYKWTLCSLNPDKILGNYIVEYLGYTTSIRDTYVLTLLIIFAIAMIFFHYTTGKKTK